MFLKYFFFFLGTGALTEEIVRAHGVVLMTGSYCQNKSFLDKWGDFCHQENIGFVACNTFGATGFCFTDFGKKWEVFDETGEPGLMRGKSIKKIFSGHNIYSFIICCSNISNISILYIFMIFFFLFKSYVFPNN